MDHRAVRDAAAAAGRDPDDITICVAAPAYVTDGTEAGLAYGREQVRWFGGMVGNHVADIVARYGDDAPVPKALTDYIKNRQGYDYNEHGQSGNTPHHVRARRDRRPLLHRRPGRDPHPTHARSEGPRRRSVRGLPAARRQVGDAASPTARAIIPAVGTIIGLTLAMLMQRFVTARSAILPWVVLSPDGGR
jgi:alkanesulfonate monooxygenase SsuD/methylene tetrahydromethanopterin reductase-like flavin-dependent oxidoreductase (luciferase family)